jgi:hypothetical protein
VVVRRKIRLSSFVLLRFTIRDLLIPSLPYWQSRPIPAAFQNHTGRQNHIATIDKLRFKMPLALSGLPPQRLINSGNELPHVSTTSWPAG